MASKKISLALCFAVFLTVQSFAAVNSLHAYPRLLRVALAEKYPHAVINVIVTAIGGEASDKSAARFDTDVLTHRPHVLFIDYALNDRRIGLEKAKAAWAAMIQKALAADMKRDFMAMNLITHFNRSAQRGRQDTQLLVSTNPPRTETLLRRPKSSSLGFRQMNSDGRRLRTQIKTEFPLCLSAYILFI